MLTGYYDGGTPANVSWQASQITGVGSHFGVTGHTGRSNATHQGGKKSEPRKTTVPLIFEVICMQKQNSCHVC